jgi:predicted DNA-binding transcriptional regulator YafY
MSDAGRHSLDAIGRMLRVLAVLETAGAGGVRQVRLPKLAGYAAGPENPRRLLARDIGELNRAGWEIIAVGAGSGMRYVLTVGGARVPVRLDREQEAALLSAARSAAGAAAPPTANRSAESLACCVRAVGARALLSFAYRGRHRRVHPRAVEPGPAGWYVVGREDGDGPVDRHFALAQMDEVTLGAPGSAHLTGGAPGDGRDPLSWLVDPPEEVRLRTAARLADEVEHVLGPAMRRERVGDEVVLTIAVTHQAAFRHRLYTLGGRVQVLGPALVRAGILAELAELVGAP